TCRSAGSVTCRMYDKIQWPAVAGRVLRKPDSAGPPADRRRLDACAAGAAALVGQGQRRNEYAVVLCGSSEQFRLDVADHQLGPTEPRESPTLTDVTPREVEEPLALLAEHRRPAQ